MSTHAIPAACCPSCQVPLPPLLLNVQQFAQVIGKSRWTAAAILKRFELAYIPKGRKAKEVSLFEVLDWMKRKSVTNKEELRRALDGRRSVSISSQKAWKGRK